MHRNSSVPIPPWLYISSCSTSAMINIIFDSPLSSAIPNQGLHFYYWSHYSSQLTTNNFWEWTENFLDPHFSSWLFKQSSRLITSTTSPVQHRVGWRADPLVHCRNTSKFSVCYWWCDLEKINLCVNVQMSTASNLFLCSAFVIRERFGGTKQFQTVQEINRWSRLSRSFTKGQLDENNKYLTLTWS